MVPIFETAKSLIRKAGEGVKQEYALYSDLLKEDSPKKLKAALAILYRDLSSPSDEVTLPKKFDEVYKSILPAAKRAGYISTTEIYPTTREEAARQLSLILDKLDE